MRADLFVPVCPVVHPRQKPFLALECLPTQGSWVRLHTQQVSTQGNPSISGFTGYPLTSKPSPENMEALWHSSHVQDTEKAMQGLKRSSCGI